MAERGVGDTGGSEDDNPFSFKTFVSGRSKKAPQIVTDTRGNSAIDDDDIFGLDEPKIESRTDRQTTTSGATKGTSKKDKQKENPFSFKKFLSSSATSGSKGSSSSLTASVSLADDVPLPQPVSTHSSPFHSNGLPSHVSDKNSTHSSLPPEPIDCDLLAGSLDVPAYPGDQLDFDKNFKPHHFHDSDDDAGGGGDDGAAAIKDQPPSIPLALPDFLSDAAAVNNRPLLPTDGDDKSNRNRDDLLGQIKIIQEENDRLRSELARERQRNSDQSKKLSQLKVDLERQKKKEAEETAVLERAVQQVEENLVTTTKRAVQAESTVSKLKQEVKGLQGQVQSLTAELTAYRTGDGGLSDLRERTKYSSEQLASAAVVAEKNLKELMSGVDKLKLLSQVLSSLEKVKTVDPEPSPEDDTKPS